MLAYPQSLTPDEAKTAYVTARAAMLGHFLIISNEDRQILFTSFLDFVSEAASLDGLESLLLSGLQAAVVGRNEPLFERGLSVLQQVGLPTMLGGGRQETPFLDVDRNAVTYLSASALAGLGNGGEHSGLLNFGGDFGADLLGIGSIGNELDNRAECNGISRCGCEDYACEFECALLLKLREKDPGLPAPAGSQLPNPAGDCPGIDIIKIEGGGKGSSSGNSTKESLNHDITIDELRGFINPNDDSQNKDDSSQTSGNSENQGKNDNSKNSDNQNKNSDNQDKGSKPDSGNENRPSDDQVAELKHGSSIPDESSGGGNEPITNAEVADALADMFASGGKYYDCPFVPYGPGLVSLVVEVQDGYRFVGMPGLDVGGGSVSDPGIFGGISVFAAGRSTSDGSDFGGSGEGDLEVGESGPIQSIKPVTDPTDISLSPSVSSIASLSSGAEALRLMGEGIARHLANNLDSGKTLRRTSNLKD
jgi:hypothetical protein